MNLKVIAFDADDTLFVNEPYLHGKYKLVVATKGDLKDQRRKLHDSGLGKYFHHIEVMSDKQEKDYTDLLNRLEIQSCRCLFHDWKFFKIRCTSSIGNWRACCTYSLSHHLGT
jgi:FMN phosphatase YigB (HAD superfamily)